MKRLKLKKAINMLLILAMLLTALISCGDRNNGKADSTGNTTDNDGNSFSSQIESAGPTINFSGINYDGYKFTILRYDVETAVGWNGIPNDIYISPEQATDILSSAVYERNMKVYSELNVNIVMEMGTNAPKLQTENLALDILSGEAKYDLLVTRLNQYSSFVNRAETLEVNENLQLDTSYTWWDRDFIDAFTVKGKLFALISDMTYLDKLSTTAVFVNATLANDLQVTDLIKKVDNGTWTLEEMLSLAKLAEGSKEGAFGIASQNDFSYYVLHSAGIKAISSDNGELIFNLDNERSITVLQKAYSTMNESYFKNRQAFSPTTPVADFIKEFASDNDSLFMVRSVQAFYDILNYTTDYIVLPMPKYDNNVDKYSASVNGYSGLMYAVPVNAKDTERTVNVLQAMGMYSEEIVMPEFYDRVLGTRFAGNEDNSRMLDIVFSNRIYDFALYSDLGGSKGLILKSDNLGTAADTVSSSIAALKEAIQKAIGEFYVKVENYTISNN